VGVVDVLPGSASGLTGTGALAWSQRHGRRAGLRNGRRRSAPRSPRTSARAARPTWPSGGGGPIHGRPAAGSVNVLYGSGSGLTATGAQLTGASPGILDNAEPRRPVRRRRGRGRLQRRRPCRPVAAATYEDVGPLTDAGRPRSWRGLGRRRPAAGATNPGRRTARHAERRPPGRPVRLLAGLISRPSTCPRRTP
jgi:hypothetical protein